VTRCLFILLFSTGLFGASLPEADTAFGKKEYQQALQGYETLLKSPDPETRQKALYRTIESEALLFRYAAAVTRAFSSPLPSDALGRARFLLLRAEMARHFLTQYPNAVPKEAELGTSDWLRQTAPQWHRRISETFEALYKERGIAVGRKLAEEKYYIETDKADRGFVTLLDFFIHRASDYYLNFSPRTPLNDRPVAETFFKFPFVTKLSSSAASRAGLWFSAASARGRNERWELERVLLPLRFPERVKPGENTKAARLRLAQSLRQAASSFSTPGPRGEILTEAAVLLSREEQFAEAAALCVQVETKSNGTAAAERCYQLRREILTPRLSLRAEPVAPQSSTGVELSTRNLTKVHFRIVSTRPEELLELASKNSFPGFHPLRRLSHEALDVFLKKPALKGWEQTLSPGKPHAIVNGPLSSFPALEEGTYVLLASSGAEFTPKKSLVVGVPLNVTRLGLFATSGWSSRLPVPLPKREKKADGFQAYAVDASTGEPVAAEMRAYQRREWNKVVEEMKAAGKDGRLTFQASYSRAGVPWSLDLLAHFAQSHAWLDREVGLQAFSPAAFSLYVETDRPIYRPGQTIKARVTVLRKTEDGAEAYRGGQKITVELRDANREKLSEQSLDVNAMGSLAVSFTVPTAKLLGAYSVQAHLTLDGETFSGDRSVQVEEYKRPEMEITLGKGRGTWILDRPARVFGNARYLFGKGAGGAVIRYQVYREGAYPWYGRGFIRSIERELVEEGETRADAKGAFTVSFRPTAEEKSQDWRGKELPTRFRVEVEGRDAGGRTVAASELYAAARVPFHFDLKPEKNYWSPRQSPVIRVSALNANGETVPIRGRYRLHALSADLAADKKSIDAQYETRPDGKIVKEGTLDAGPLTLPPLEEGVYRLRVSEPGTPLTEETLLVPVLSEQTQLALEGVSLAERVNYVVGDTAEVVVGSARLKGKMFVQVWQGEALVRNEIFPGGIQRLKLPLAAGDRAGVTVRWFGVHQFQWRKGEVRIPVEHSEKKLQITWQPKAAYEPGEKTQWNIQVRDASGKAVDAEAIVRVYDRALEAYAPAEDDFRSALHSVKEAQLPESGSMAAVDGTQVFFDPSLWESALGLTPPKPAPPAQAPPYLRSSRSRHSYRMNFAGGARMAVQAASADAGVGAAEKSLSRKEAPTGATPPSPAPLRTDFSETALFLPQLAISRGAGTAGFTFPDSLTEWRGSVGVLTQDGKWAVQSQAMATRKDFMARLILPRFWREGDRTQVVLLLENMMDKALQGKAQISARIGARGIEKELGIETLTLPFTVLPLGQTRLAWNVRAPKELGEVWLETRADAGNYRDAEVKSIPVLPARERLVDSRFTVVQEGSPARLTPPALGKEDSREQTTLQVDPQLFSTLLSGLPRLIHTSSSSTDAVLYRWLPLAVMGVLYDSHPELRKLAERLPRRQTPLPAWEEKEARRQVSLEETPWRAISRGGSTDLPQWDLLDSRLVGRREQTTLAELRALQLSTGAFPWYPGGEADWFVTLTVLGALAEAKELGVAIPEDLVHKAFDFAAARLAEHLASRVEKQKPALALGLYATYVLSAYVEAYPWAKEMQAPLLQFMEGSEDHRDAFTALGKAYAAWSWRRLGNPGKSDALLDQALDGAREDAIAGVYWQPEPLSWHWYSDTLDKHAFLLRTLARLRPTDRRVPGLTRWLLFNRKGNSWESPRAAMGAFFALTQTMTDGKLSDFSGKLSVQWPPMKETLKISLETILEKPMRWTKSESEVGTATLQYEGKGLAFASLTTVFSSAQPPPPPKDGLLVLERSYFRKTAKGWAPLKDGDSVRVGEEVQVVSLIRSRSQFEYVQLRLPRGAGFEAKEKLSGYRFDKLGYYQEPRDSRDNFYFSWIPQGDFRFETVWFATTVGDFQIAPALLQSVYAPEMATYARGFRLSVRE